MGHDRGEESRELHVLRVGRGPGALGLDVDARGDALLPDVAEVAGVLERHFVRHGEGGGDGDERPIARSAAARGVDNGTWLSGEFGCGHSPLPGGGGYEDGAGRGSGLPVLFPRVGHRGRSAGPLDPEHEVGVFLGVGRGSFDPHRRPLGVELVGHDGRKAGVGPLPHLKVLGEDGHRAVGIDADEGVGREGGSSADAILCLGDVREGAAGVDTDQEAATDRRAHADEVATAVVRWSLV